MESKKNILVTGGAGYIGSFMVKELLDQGYDVVVIDSLENGHKEAVDPRATLEVLDLGNSDGLDKIFKKYSLITNRGQSPFRDSPHLQTGSSGDSPRIHAVIDFAAYLAVGESMEEPERYLQNNVANFVNLLDAMVANGCKYIIKSSTASTYGNPEDKYFPLKENYQSVFKPAESALLQGTWPNKHLEGGRPRRFSGFEVKGEEFFQKIIGWYNQTFKDRPELQLTEAELTQLRIPASVYGLTKLVDEILMKKYAKRGISSVALRYFNVCGAAMDGSMGEDKPKPTTLMTVCFWVILKRLGSLGIFGTDYPTKDGTGVRDYIHPLDVATGHIAALEYLENRVNEPNRSNRFDVFNLGTGEGYSVFEVIKAIESASGKKVKYTVKGRRSGDPAVSYSDPSKSTKLLGWKTRYNLQDMAESAWKWHLTHPHRYS